MKGELSIMNRLLLSICIPVYNRKDIFKYCLLQAAKAVSFYSDQVEIVVSDNNSEENLIQIINSTKVLFPQVKIVYNRNETNEGVAYNTLKAVSLASGEFVWIIGSDDFIKPWRFNKVVETLNSNNDVDFISVNFDHIHFDKMDKNHSDSDRYIDLLSNLESENFLVKKNRKNESGPMSFVNLIDPRYDNVFLGAIMVGIFRKSIWDSVDKSNYTLKGFDSVDSMYPWCTVYAEGFMRKKAYHLSDEVLTVGEGAREWSTETGNDFWNSSMPIIYLKVFGDIVYQYYNKGLPYNQFKKCKKWASRYAGRYFIQYFFHTSIMRKKVKSMEKISCKQVILRFWNDLTFYRGIVEVIPMLFKKRKGGI